MREFNDLQQLWKNNESSSSLKFEELMQSIRQRKKDFTNKLFVQVLTFVFTLTLLIFIWIYFSLFTWTSHLGFVILIACLVFATFQHWISYKKMEKSTYLLEEPNKSILYLENFIENRNRLNTKIFSLYEILITFSFGLFLFELYFALPFYQFILLIVFFVVWFLFSHFIWMKNFKEAENQRIQAILDDLNRIQGQFESLK